MKRLPILTLAVFLLGACNASEPDSPSFAIDYERYVLDNGLEVILHEDHSDPIVAVATLMHVGSAREKPGRTGFAHFFEHMSFNDSENVPVGANRKMIPELGGQRNGGTWSDGTIYYEVVPTDAFEKILWIDSDRLGYMINTVTPAALEREKQVVKNEKRERVDNAPYGHEDTVTRAALYPPDHPYHWTVIGSLPDLQAATLADVKEFYSTFYGANNATLVIAGDIDVARTKELVNYWFGEIKPVPEPEPLTPRPAGLATTVSLYHEDNFAKLPQLSISWPTVEQYHLDSYALDVLADVLAGSKQAPLYQVIVEEQKLAPAVRAFSDTSELAGTFDLRVRANAGTDLDAVQAAIDEGMARFERDGFSEAELQRVKAQRETGLYNGFASVLSKAFQLCQYNAFAHDPGYIRVEAERMRAVTREDVMDVYARYLQGKPCVKTSFVPRGEVELALTGSGKAEVFEEEIVANAENEQVSQGDEAEYERTVTVADRSEPPLGPMPLLRTPQVWTADLDNGMDVLGIQNSEVPLVVFDLTIEGGHWLDPIEDSGTASLLADLMMQGTVSRTAAELEEALGLLGAFVSIDAGAEEIRIHGNTLARNFEPTLALVEEILLEPRWDAVEFDRLKRELDTRLTGLEAEPRSISANVFRRLLYGEDHIFGTPDSGTKETTAGISLEDLQQFYATRLSPTVAHFHVVGAIDEGRVLAALSGIEARWAAREVPRPTYTRRAPPKAAQLYFVDVPDAKQSVLRIGRLALAVTDPDYTPLTYANQVLGGGSSGRLFQTLRIEKGYTYGAYSTVVPTHEIAPWLATGSVRTNVTLESLELIHLMMKNYSAQFGPEEMATTKNQVVKANTREFEALNAKLDMLQTMSQRALPSTYLEDDQRALLAMDLEEFHRLIETYIRPDEMVYLVVGDAATQRARLGQLGLGAPQDLDVHGSMVP